MKNKKRLKEGKKGEWRMKDECWKKEKNNMKKEDERKKMKEGIKKKDWRRWGKRGD